MANSFAHQPQSGEQQVSTDFPRWAYGPGGQAQIFERAEDIPEGWEDHPSKVRVADEVEESTEQVEESVSEVDMRVSLDEKKVPELQSMAEELGLDKNGKKSELIDRIVGKLVETQSEDPSAEVL